jgi:Right handed beta helix region
MSRIRIGSIHMRLKVGLAPRIPRAHPTRIRQRSATEKILLRLLLAMTIAPWLHALPAQAQAMSTFVSRLGSDSGPCTAAAPCQTLQRALAKTRAGGQISALDSGNFGSVTINQAVSISGSGATGVLATSGVTGITINAGANDIINLQGLDIDGAGSGANGIQFNTGGLLTIQDSVIRGFSNGINFQPNGSSALSVGNTVVSSNSTGISFQSSATSTGILNAVHLVNNGTGIAALGASSTGSASVTVQNSLVVNNGTIGILSGGFSAVMVANSTIAGNAVGLEAQNTGATLQVAGSTLTGNGTGMLAANGGQLLSGRGNSVDGNSSGNSIPSASPPPTFNLMVSASTNRSARSRSTARP